MVVAKVMNFKYLIVTLFFIKNAHSQVNSNRSLTYVIDTTRSMFDDIDEVVKGAREMSKIFVNTNDSVVKNFVLVNFTDFLVWPKQWTETLVNTNNFNAFYDRLSALGLNSLAPINSVDCAETSLAGLQRGLLESSPYSYIYVFTDADAKDLELKDKVISLGQEKRCQISFIFSTSGCITTEINALPLYTEIATATSGQAYVLKEQNFDKILNVIQETLRKQTEVLVIKKLGPGDHTVKFNKDNRTNGVMVSVAGNDVNVHVKAGSPNTTTQVMVDTPHTKVHKIDSIGEDEIEINIVSDFASTLRILGQTNFTFQYGFSTFKPNKMEATSTQPLPGKPSYVAVQLMGDTFAVRLEKVKIMAMNDIVLAEMIPSNTTREGFYVTDLFEPPSDNFKLEITCFDEISNKNIVRISSTTTAVQNPSLHIPKDLAPIVKIEGDAEIIGSYEKSLEIICKVKGYPKPEIMWRNAATGVVMPSLESQLDIPYDYVSILKIESVTKNETYKCMATNALGSDNEETTVSVTRKIPATIVSNRSKIFLHKHVLAGQNLFLPCKVTGDPTPNIVWWWAKNASNKKLTVRTHHTSSGTLKLHNVKLHDEGFYTCIARNNAGKDKVTYIVSVYERPKINKTNNTLDIAIGTSATVSCPLLKGKPTPSWNWKYKAPGGKLVALPGKSDVLQKSTFECGDGGEYTCIADNGVGTDSFTIDVMVKCPPMISKNDTTVVVVNDGEKVHLDCKVVGYPTVYVEWQFNDDPIRNIKRRRKFQVFRDHSLGFVGRYADSGRYSCIVFNDFGVAEKEFIVRINEAPYIEPPTNSSLSVIQDSSLTLDCDAYGRPKPTIKWIHWDKITNRRENMHVRQDGRLELNAIQGYQEGLYTCVATNEAGSYNISYQISVSAVPKILTDKADYQAVLNDKALKIPCYTQGSPKPNVTWYIVLGTELPIPVGSKWYDVMYDNSLVIKDITKDSAAQYICKARNNIGVDIKKYNVEVLVYPEELTPTTVITADEGDVKTITCDIKQLPTDHIRWYKDGQQIAAGLLTKTIQSEDAGVYTCRVSNLEISRSASTRLIVRQAPVFISFPQLYLKPFYREALVLDCETKAFPKAKVQWEHDGTIISSNDKLSVLFDSYRKRGVYVCTVSNDLGEISRTFNVA